MHQVSLSHFRQCLVNLQRDEDGENAFSELRLFYRDVLKTFAQKSIDSASKIAADCVDLWMLAGISHGDLGMMCAAAASIAPCLRDEQMDAIKLAFDTSY
jgi:hypothetical protein